MNLPNIAGAIEYARSRMAMELAPELTYHNLFHTFEDVLPASMQLADLCHLSQDDTSLLAVAVAFHDIGWIKQGEGHETISIEIASEILPDFGFRSEEIDKIARIIMATRIPQSPTNLLEEIMADADLDTLGRDDFWARKDDLLKEITYRGIVMSEEDWLRRQIPFLKEHRYFTAAAKSLRDGPKQENLEVMEKLLAEINQRKVAA